MYSNCILHCSWLEGQYPKNLCAQENKKEDNSNNSLAENAFQGCTNSVCVFSRHEVNSKWNLRSSNQILGKQHDLQIVHLCFRQTDLANAVPWKTPSFQPPRSLQGSWGNPLFCNCWAFINNNSNNNNYCYCYCCRKRLCKCMQYMASPRRNRQSQRNGLKVGNGR